MLDVRLSRPGARSMPARLSSFHQQSREAFEFVTAMSALNAPLAGGNHVLSLIGFREVDEVVL